MNASRTMRGAALVAIVALLAGCDQSPTPSPAPSAAPTLAPTTPPPTATPSPTVAAPIEFPLAVVTGLTNLKSRITEDEVVALAADGKLLLPCDVDVVAPALTSAATCTPADEIAAAIDADQKAVALLPPGLVEPATKVLPIAGDGPFGLFGPDLFGAPPSREGPYPITGSAAAAGPSALDATWTAYDPAQVWTMTSIGSLCADRWAAHQAVTLGKGWHWVFNGGTAKYEGKPYPNPDPPPGINVHPIVDPVQTGNDGATAEIQRRADVAIADHECPIMPNNNWSPNDQGGGLVFAVPEAIIPEWQDTLGIDVVYLAANHMSDRGTTGIRSTLKLLDKHGLPRTGLGMNLTEALQPAFLEVAGLTVAFVAWNDVGGVARADADTAGVAWITRNNVNKAVRLAREGGADLVICDPQWWGGVEYHDDLLAKQVTQLGWFDEAGCDHVIGAGTHVAGPLLLRARPDGVSLVLASPGNYVFGQDFWQNTQEGVILEQTFVGTRMVNARMHPYVIILGARPALTDPQGDGRYVLQRIFRNSEVDYLP